MRAAGGRHRRERGARTEDPPAGSCGDTTAPLSGAVLLEREVGTPPYRGAPFAARHPESAGRAPVRVRDDLRVALDMTAPGILLRFGPLGIVAEQGGLGPTAGLHRLVVGH